MVFLCISFIVYEAKNFNVFKSHRHLLFCKSSVHILCPFSFAQVQFFLECTKWGILNALLLERWNLKDITIYLGSWVTGGCGSVGLGEMAQGEPTD